MLGTRVLKGHDVVNRIVGFEDTFTFRGLSSSYLPSIFNHVTT